MRFLKGVRDAWSCATDKLNSQSWTSSQKATGQGVRRPNSRLRLRTWCLVGISLPRRQQLRNVEATSSGEAEFYALTKSAPRALGAVAMAADMAKVVKPRVRVDATASKAIALRRGVERVRHLHTQVLWMQEAVARRELTIAKVQGVENPADMGTKH